MAGVRPAQPTDEIFPTWVDIDNNWRAVDCHWLRNRTVQIFDDAAERSTKLKDTGASTATDYPVPGMLSLLKTTHSLEFWTGTSLSGAWETVRYPGLTVTPSVIIGPPAVNTIALTQGSAGGGVVLRSDNAVQIGLLYGGQPVPASAAGGVVIDMTGLSIRTGTGNKVVKLTTNATSLLSDSPLSVTGDITAGGALKGASATITGALSAASFSAATGAVSAQSLSITGSAAIGGTLDVGGNAEIVLDPGLSVAMFRNKQTPIQYLSFSNAGDAILKGSTVRIDGASSISIVGGPMSVSNITTFTALPFLKPAGITGMIQAQVAGVHVSTVAPVQGTDIYPDGTIWLQV